MKVVERAKTHRDFDLARCKPQFGSEKREHLVEIVMIDFDQPAIAAPAAAEVTHHQDAKRFIRIEDGYPLGFILYIDFNGSA